MISFCKSNHHQMTCYDLCGILTHISVVFLLVSPSNVLTSRRRWETVCKTYRVQFIRCASYRTDDVDQSTTACGCDVETEVCDGSCWCQPLDDNRQMITGGSIRCSQTSNSTWHCQASTPTYKHTDI